MATVTCGRRLNVMQSIINNDLGQKYKRHISPFNQIEVTSFGFLQTIV